MSTLRITRLGHGGILYRSPADRWLWVDRWSGAPTYVAPPDPWRVDVVAPTHGHFDHVGDDATDVAELVRIGADGAPATVVCSHEMSLYLGEKGIEAVGMNKGGTFDAAGIGLTMVHAEHTGAVTLTGGGPTSREVGCWGWLLEFEDGTRVYHTGDTDLFGDMALVRDRWSPTITVLPIGGHFTMGPADAARAVRLIGARTVVPVHYGTFPILAGTPDALAAAISAQEATFASVVALEPGETWTAGS